METTWRRRLGLAVCGVLSLAASAREACAQTPHASAQAVQRLRLDNGLTVVLAPDATSANVNVVVRYEAGQAHDPVGYPGLAHLLEHVTFRGSSHLRPLEGVSILGELGAGYNAVTDLETTEFFTEAPSAGLETVLWLESERMGFALGGVDAKGLEAEQRVVASELRQRARTMGAQLGKLWLNALYGPAHPFARAEDEVAAVKAVDLPGLQWFYQRTYRPDNATLVLTGDFAAEQTRSLIEKYFGPLKNPRLPRASLTAAAPKLCGVHRLNVEHPFLFGKSLWLTWPGAPAATVSQRQHRDGLAKLLRARLEEVLLARGVDASSVNVENDYFRSHSLFTVRLELYEAGSPEKVEQAVRSEVRKLTTQLPSDQELRSVRAGQVSERVFSGSGSLSRAIELADGIDSAHAPASLLSPADLRDAALFLHGPLLIFSSKPGDKGTRATAVTSSEDPCH